MAWQGLAAEFLQVPAVTRAYTAACVLTTAAVFQVRPPRAAHLWARPTHPAPDRPSPVGLEARHQLPLLRAPGIQLLLQHALRVPLLPHAGRGLLPRPHGRLRLHVSLRGRPYDPAGTPGQPVLPGPGPHGHAGVRVEPPQPSGEGQLLRPAHFPGTVPALGAHGLLAAAGQLHPRGPAGTSSPTSPEARGSCRPLASWDFRAARPQLAVA
ncbi:derlin-3 isoform X15 [Pan troglodytes]|uniref:derlin-3 isoform X15 n=1 Tax=Pan troglodytes TaxID=9598 RepID=UPI0023EFBA16|nr:derlin-3 isoform X15 [Pan troglodytes]